MLLIYRHLINIFFPLIIIVVFLRSIFGKEDKDRFNEKIFKSSFLISKNKKKKLIWFHAASIGELKSIIPLIKKLNKTNKFEFLITTVTLSSANLFEKELINEKDVIHRFFPVDKISLVKNFLNGWSPSLIIFIDSEIWPNFLFEIKSRNIPLVLLNGRITKKTFLRWNIFPKTAKKIFQSFDLCLPSSMESKKYLEKFNVKKINYIGNLKFASEKFNTELDKKNKEILHTYKFWCAVSTHKGEDNLCLQTHLKIKENLKNFITIIIPRHINRSKEIEISCKKLNLKSQVLSDGELIDSGNEIIIVNSYGSISNFLAICKSVFIGKSMIKSLELVGGQNPIEAAKSGCKIYHGPFVYNFQEVYDLLNKYKVSEQVNTIDELANKLSVDLNKSNIIEKEKIEIIDNLGKQILDDTYNELIKII